MPFIMTRGYVRSLNRADHGADEYRETIREHRKHGNGPPFKFTHMYCTRCEKKHPLRSNTTRRFLLCDCGGVLVYQTAPKAA